MSRKWDSFTPKSFQEFSYQWGKEALRVLKPGAWLLAFSGTRTYHRMVCGLEDAGFKIVDMVEWMYGAGFSKALDISKAIDAHFGKLEEREVIGKGNAGLGKNKPAHEGGFKEDYNLTKPITPEAQKFEGWKSQLKPSHEPIVLAQKPYEKTFAFNTLKYGVSGLNIDGCRIRYSPTQETDSRITTPEKNITRGKHGENSMVKYAPDGNEFPMYNSNKGRFPSNTLLSHHPACVLVGSKKVGSGSKAKKSDNRENKEVDRFLKGLGVHDPNNTYGIEQIEAYDCHPDCPVRLLDEQSGNCKTGEIKPYLQKGNSLYGVVQKGTMYNNYYPAEQGGASRYFKTFAPTRFFYSGKAHKSERNAGLEGLPNVIGGLHNESGRPLVCKCKKCEKEIRTDGRENRCKCETPQEYYPKVITKNDIATLKPISVMRYLVRLCCPKGGTVLDPFAGSGTTGIACIIEGMNYILIEKRKRFAKVIIPKRLSFWKDSNNWSILKDHNALPKIKKLQVEKQNRGLSSWL